VAQYFRANLVKAFGFSDIADILWPVFVLGFDFGKKYRPGISALHRFIRSSMIYSVLMLPRRPACFRFCF
jgi:hypothetical protein